MVTVYQEGQRSNFLITGEFLFARSINLPKSLHGLLKMSLCEIPFPMTNECSAIMLSDLLLLACTFTRLLRLLGFHPIYVCNSSFVPILYIRSVKPLIVL